MSWHTCKAPTLVGCLWNAMLFLLAGVDLLTFRVADQMLTVKMFNCYFLRD